MDLRTYRLKRYFWNNTVMLDLNGNVREWVDLEADLDESDI